MSRVNGNTTYKSGIRPIPFRVFSLYMAPFAV